RSSLFPYTTLFRSKISEKLHVRVPVRSEDLRVSFFPEGGAWVAGMPGTLMIKAYDAYGNDFPFLGQIVDKGGAVVTELESDESGLASADMIPSLQGGEKLQITYPYPLNKTFDLPMPKQEGMRLTMSHE